MDKTKLIYCCKEKNCNNKIHWCTALYRGGRCGSCARTGKRNSNYKNKFPVCINCGKKCDYWQRKRCNKCNKIFLRLRSLGKKNNMYGKLTHSKRIYYNNICFRSTWEVNFAKFLDLSGIEYQYEPKTFDLGNATYTPDFYIPEWDLYIEIKGWWRGKAKKKFRLFKRKYRNIKIFNRNSLTKYGIIKR